jgi:hypothetical protein
MLHIVQVEEIETLLLQLPSIIQKQQERSVDFVTTVGVWLHSLEKIFNANRLYQASNIAILRSKLVAAEQGHVPTELKFRNKPSRSQILNVIAAQVLQDAVEIASSLIAENRPRIEEAERVAQQIIVFASAHGLIIARSKEVSNSHYLLLLRNSLASNADSQNAVVHLEGLVGSHDTLILLDRALSTIWIPLP